MRGRVAAIERERNLVVGGSMPQILPSVTTITSAHWNGVRVQQELLSTASRKSGSDRSVEQSAVSGNQSSVVIKRHLISPYKKAPHEARLENEKRKIIQREANPPRGR